MSKLLTVVSGVLVTVGCVLLLREPMPPPRVGGTVAAVVVVCATVLAVLLLTRRPLSATQRRGSELGPAGAPSVVGWLLGAPFIACLAVLVGGLLIVTVLALFAGDADGGDGPQLDPRRVARNSWRLWAGVLGGVVVLVVIAGIAARPEDSGDAVPTLLLGLIALTATRLVTRSMDRADARRTVAAAGGTG
ncbi:MAG: hypothetical protein KY451_12225 [Actinobacteria bacterium]|nr:hypothetical protein [Actinomycetota bacterium]MBW3647898.1 hypothetical protein [Actinomycetota bacterium]